MAITYVEADSGAGGAKLATDQIATVDYPICKIDNGAAGAAGGPVSAGNPLPVVLEAGAAVVGQVTANAGTNLNTSALSLESGGNLDTIAAAAVANAVSNDSIDGKITVCNTGAVTVSASALPTGAATAAKQLADGHNVAINAAIPAGANAIGKLAENDGIDIGDVDVITQPARDNGTDTITASLDTAAIMNDTTPLTPKFAAISGASSGDNTLVAAVSAKKIRILSLTVIAAGAVDIRLEDGAGGGALTGVMSLTTNSGFSLNFSPVGHGETTANTLLNMELSAAVQVSGLLTYVEV